MSSFGSPELPPKRSWWAIAGPSAAVGIGGVLVTPFDKTAVLDGDYEVGQLSVRPGGKLLTEYIRSEPTTLAGVTTIESWPVIIEGWGDADQFSQDLHGDLRRLACLLSLGWREPWTIRSAPADSGSLPPAVPDSWQPPGVAAYASQCPSPLSEPRSLPRIVRTGWDVVVRKPDVRDALLRWHESFLAWPAHPSLAFTGFVTVLEHLAYVTMLVDSDCSSSKAFEAALERWASPTAATLLRDRNPYNMRSRILHNGRSHGVEPHASRLFSIEHDLEAGTAEIAGDDASFVIQVVGAVESAARSAVETALVQFS